MLVGSAIPGRGQELFCAANLAVVFAQAGLKTLLIDADLRLPTAFQYFGVKQDELIKGFPRRAGREGQPRFGGGEVQRAEPEPAHDHDRGRFPPPPSCSPVRG